MLINFLDISLRSFLSVAVLFLLTKLMGVKQISQMSFFDYVIGISIGSIAAAMACEQDVAYEDALISMAMYALIAILISYITNKSMKARRFLTGTSVVLIDHGKIIEDNLEKVKFDVNELLAECRSGGYFNVSDLEYAIMESSGKISFLPKSEKRPLTPEDIQLTPAQELLTASVIIDGNIMPNNLRSIGKDEKWLKKQLRSQKIGSIHDILLATVDSNSELSVYFKHESAHKFTLLD